MGNGKKKRKAKRKLEAYRRRDVKRKMGKPVFLNLCKTPKSLKGLSDRYIYKANLYRVLYTNGHFYNVRWNASNITRCSFKNTYCKGVDFVNSNLKKTSFKGAILENVMFFNCNLKDVDFENAQFKSVYFVSTNIENAKNLNLDANCKIYSSYPKLDVGSTVKNALFQIYKTSSESKCNVLLVNESKLNLWIVKILYDNYGEDIYRALLAFCRKKYKQKFFTLFSYEKHIVNYLKL